METGQETTGFRSLEDVLENGDTPPVETPPVEGSETPPVETPPVETPPVETPPVETPPAETPPVEETPPTESVFDINDFNQRFGTEFDTDDAFKTFFEQSKKDSQRIVELEATAKEIDDLKEQNLVLKENFDPMKHFASEDDYKANLFKKQFPDKDAAVAYKLLTTDVSALSDKDAVAYQMMLDNPGLDRATVDAVVDDKYGIDDGEEMDTVSKAKMKIDANSARKEISTMSESLKLPEKVDVDSLTQEQIDLRKVKADKLKEGWQGISKEVAGSLNDVVITDKVDGQDVELFRYSIDKDFPDDVVAQMAENMSNAGVEISQDTVKSAADVMRQIYLSQNIETIVKSAIDNAMAKAEEKRLTEQHNPGTPKPDSNVAPGGQVDADAKFLGGMKGFEPRRA